LKILVSVLIGLALVGFALASLWFYFDSVANPRVVREITADPDGERARKVMLVTLPSGRQLPVNYLREADRIYAGADGTWWKELVGDGVPVSLLVRGETLRGTARAVRDDPAYTREIFARLRPNAIEGFGTLVEVRLAAPASR
jgi:hypothetical protein